MSRETLASYIAVELTDSFEVHDSKPVKQIRILLYHIDAPTLADRGLVTYDHYIIAPVGYELHNDGSC